MQSHLYNTSLLVNTMYACIRLKISDHSSGIYVVWVYIIRGMHGKVYYVKCYEVMPVPYT